MSMNEAFNEDQILEIQQDLLESSLELAFSTYDNALKSGMKNPVVFVLDCEDAVGREIADQWLGREAVDEAIEQQQLLSETEDPQTTVFAYAFPYKTCCTEVPAVFDYLAPVFESDPPADGFLAIAVTCGGASALTVPHSVRNSI